MLPANEIIISSLQSELQKLYPQIPKFKKTYLEILKVSRREVPIANLLAYFFDPNESHGLGELFIKALLETDCYDLKTHKTANELFKNGYLHTENGLIANPQFELNKVTDVEVKPEEPTYEYKRIDILIKAQQFIIAIEFKINHVLDNPLHLYEKHILKNHCTENNKPVFFVVLSPSSKQQENQHIASDTFKQVILSAFVEKIKHHLTGDGLDKIKANDYYPLLNDFIQTIENRKKHKDVRDLLLANTNVVELYKGLTKNKLIQAFQAQSAEQVNGVVKKLIAIEEDITTKLNSVKKEFKDAKYKEIDCFEGFVEIAVPDSINAIKCRLTLAGWKLEVWESVSGKGFTNKNNNIPNAPFRYETSSATMAAKIKAIVANGIPIEDELVE
jgi:hypothetical protein